MKTEGHITENTLNTEGHSTENTLKTEGHITENILKTEGHITENTLTTELHITENTSKTVRIAFPRFLSSGQNLIRLKNQSQLPRELYQTQFLGNSLQQEKKNMK